MREISPRYCAEIVAEIAPRSRPRARLQRDKRLILDFLGLRVSLRVSAEAVAQLEDGVALRH